MPSAQEAAAAIRSAFAQVHGRAPTDRELLILLAHAQIESGWGAASYREWPLSAPTPPNPPVRRAGTNNWGAVQWTGTNGVEGQDFFYGLDTHADGRPYRAKIRLYSTAAAGAVDFVINATKARGRDKSVLPFLDAGDPYDYARRSSASGYFELAPEKAGKAFAEAAAGIARKLGIAPPASGSGGGFAVDPAGAGFAAVAAIVIAGVAVWAYTRKD